MKVQKSEIAEEVNDIVCCALTTLNSGAAFGFVVITGTPELTNLHELQLFLGWNPAHEFASELERQLRAGRTVLAICVLVHVGRGNIYRDIHIAQPYAADSGLRCSVARIVAAHLGH